MSGGAVSPSIDYVDAIVGVVKEFVFLFDRFIGANFLLFVLIAAQLSSVTATDSSTTLVDFLGI